MTAPFETRVPDWLSVGEAVRRVLTRANPLPPVALPLEAALGAVTADDVVARATLPPWDNSAMDGYAARTSDVRAARAHAPVELRVIGASPAGADPSRLPTVEAGTAVRIMTGAPLPPGADCVIRVEHTDAEADDDVVRILDASDAGRNVRPRGEDMVAGDPLLPAGAEVTPGRAALLAAAGADPVAVHRPPRVRLVPTGDELRTAAAFDDVMRGLGIPETNGRMLSLATRAAGGVPELLAPVADDETALAGALRALDGVDVLVTLAGASMGTGDLVKEVLDAHGFRLDFWRVTMRPGSPFGFGWIEREGGPDLPVFSLPGNPSSAFVTFQLFVRPFLRAISGRTDLFRPVVDAVTEEEFPANPRLTCFHRVSLDVDDDGVVTAELTGPQGSGLVSGLAAADGLAVVPAGMERCPEGSRVEVILLDDGPPGIGRLGFEPGVAP